MSPIFEVDAIVFVPSYLGDDVLVEGVTSQIIYDKITVEDKILITKEELMDQLTKRMDEGRLDLVATFGAGNIDRFVKPIAQMIEKKI